MMFKFKPALAMAAVALAVVFNPLQATPKAYALDEGPRSVAGLAERLSPAVVNISTSQKVRRKSQNRRGQQPGDRSFREFFEEYFKNEQSPRNRPRRRPRTVSSLGSGFVIDPSGVIVTNNHVIDQADEVFVTFSDGKKLKAEVRGRDPKTDLAVLLVKPEKPLPFVKMGDSGAIRVGDWVMAIGNPFGFSGTVTLGIVSASNRNLGSGPYDSYIQTDAAINRGNSGGPLFNMKGEVIGVNTAIISRTGGSIGLGFAVPTSIAAGVIKQLWEFKETRRGWLGVKIQSVNEDMVESLGLDRPRGALVADVTATGPAEAAGLKAGDVILKFNGREVARMRDLPRVVAETAVGEEVVVEVLRGGKPIEFKVVLGRLEDGEKIAASAPGADGGLSEGKKAPPVLGMRLAPLSAGLRERFKITGDIKGVIVTEVEPDSAASDKSIRPGDVIMEADGQPVTSAADLAAKVKQRREDGVASILVMVRAGGGLGQNRFIALRISKGG